MLKRFSFLHRDPKWREAIHEVHRYVDQHIDDAFERVKSDAADTRGSRKRYILLDAMASQIQDKEQLRSQILGVFLPGHDTTAYSVGNVFHHLARRPDVWAKLRAEVLSKGSEAVTFELLKSMRYLQWVLAESKWPFLITTR